MKINVKTLSFCLGLAPLAFGQTTTAPIYTASIYAGQPTAALGDGGPANVALVSEPRGVAVDSAGNIYISDNANDRIRKIDASTGNISTFVKPGGPNGLAIDKQGFLYVASGDHKVYQYDLSKASPSQVTIAGDGGNRCCGDGQPAVRSHLNSPGGVAVDDAGNVYIADTSNNRIRMVTNANNCIYNAPTTCIINTIAGPGGTSAASAGTPAFGGTTSSSVGNNTVGDGGLAIQARVNGPFGIAVTPDGSTVYFSDTADHRIRIINMQTGKIDTLLGSCTNNSTSSSASGSTVSSGTAVTTNPSASAPDTKNFRQIVIPCPSGSFGSATANSTNSFNSVTNTLYDGQVGTSATANNPRGLFLDNTHQKLYFADSSNNRVRVVDLNTGVVTSVVGTGNTGGSNANDGPPLTSLNIASPYGVWMSTSGLLYFVENITNRVRVVDPVQNVTHSLTGLPRSTGTGGNATDALLGIPTATTTSGAARVAVDYAGNVYVVETAVNKIRKISPDGTISDWAGSGQTTTLSANPVTGIPIDGGPAIASRLNNPGCVTFDAQGNGYIADTGENLIRKVDTNGNISTVAGRFKVKANSNPSQGCDPKSQAQGTCRVDPSSNYLGDGGPATQAILNSPQCVASDAAGNLFITDTGNHAIRRVDAASGSIDTIAGGVSAHIAGGPTDGRSGLGTSGAQGEGQNALYALFNIPRGIAVDSKGNVYVADYNNQVVRKLSPGQKGGYNIVDIFGAISSSNNDGIGIPTGTGNPTDPVRARFGSAGMTSVAVDPSGNIYLTDTGNSKILVESADQTKIYEIAGGGSQDTGLTYTSSNGFNLQVPNATGVAVDPNNFAVYTIDRLGAVKKLTPPKSGFPAH